MNAPPPNLRELRARIGPAALRRAAAAACWEAGDLSYALHDGQVRAVELVREAHRRGVRRSVWNIARRWGKSRAAVTMSAELCLRHPADARPARIPYAAMTEGTVAEFIAPHLYELGLDAPERLRPEEARGEWLFPSTGSRIVMRGCEDRKKADRLRGPSATFAVIDEAGFIPDLDYVVRSVIAPQLITTDGHLLAASSPPVSPEHPFRSLALEAEERGAYMHAPITSAPHLDPAAVARFCAEVGGEGSAAWRREGLALFVVDETRALVPEFERLEDAVVGVVDRPRFFDAYVVGDLGYVDLTVLLFGYWHFELALLVVEDEVVLRRPTSDDVHRAAAAKERELWGGQEPLVRAVDAPAITVADLRRLQPPTPGRDEDDPARWHAVAHDELEAALNALRLRITRGGIVIHPRCRTLRAHLRAGVWNSQRTSFARVETSDGGHHFDAVAAAVYLNRTVRVDRNPEPAGLEVTDPMNQRVRWDLIRERERGNGWKRAANGRRMERR